MDDFVSQRFNGSIKASVHNICFTLCITENAESVFLISRNKIDPIKPRKGVGCVECCGLLCKSKV